MPLVLCTTGLSPEQIEKVKETSKTTAILRSANMSLGINTLMKLVQDAAKVLANAGFDIEIVEKHHNKKLDAPSGTALMLAIFALQDSFGTACNVTGDGALTLMLTGYAEKHGIQNNDNLQTPIL